jgi:hypothetical protein
MHCLLFDMTVSCKRAWTANLVHHRDAMILFFVSEGSNRAESAAFQLTRQL